MISIDLLKSKLEAALNPVHLNIIDASDGCGQAFECQIVSTQFEGKSMLQQHRLVNEVLKDEIKQIHAFSVKTFASMDKFNSLNK